MFTKNLVISTVGKNSLHNEWLVGDPNFDLALICYEEVEELNLPTNHIYHIKGNQKLPIIKKFIETNLDFINKYDYIWMPDDDISCDASDINSLFEIHSEYKLWLSQPSLSGFISHEITKHRPDFLLRYVNFVEVMCPMMTLNTFLALSHTFNLTESSWGIDFLWNKVLRYPEDKMAIIDKVIVKHTKVVGEDYSRFIRSPALECGYIMKKYNLNSEHKTYSTVTFS